MRKYDSREEIGMRLRNSLVFDPKAHEFVYVERINNRNGDVRIATTDYTERDGLILSKQREVNLYDDLEYAKLPTLGFFNVQDVGAVWAQRAPARRAGGQGLSNLNIRLYPAHDHRRVMADWFFCKAFSDAFGKHKYPSFADAWQQVTKNGKRSWAFSPTFAVTNEGSICRRNKKIGTYDARKDAINLNASDRCWIDEFKRNKNFGVKNVH